MKKECKKKNNEIKRRNQWRQLECHGLTELICSIACRSVSRSGPPCLSGQWKSMLPTILMFCRLWERCAKRKVGLDFEAFHNIYLVYLGPSDAPRNIYWPALLHPRNGVVNVLEENHRILSTCLQLPFKTSIVYETYSGPHRPWKVVENPRTM